MRLALADGDQGSGVGETPSLSDVSGPFYQQLRDIQSRLLPDSEYEWSVSLSGREANNVFFNLQGQRFEDLSGLSGFDDEADGRALVLWDPDRDGYVDLAVANANAPRLQLFRNTLGDRRRDAEPDFVAVRLVGGADGRGTKGEEESGFSSRDACGALLELTLADGAKQIEELHCGEGFAAQNSATVLFGLGDRGGSSMLQVRWPSGRQQIVGPIGAGSRVTVFEDQRQVPEGGSGSVRQQGAVVERYLP